MGLTIFRAKWQDPSMDLTNGLSNDASALYGPYEQVISDWPQLQHAINVISDAYRHEQFVWRGQASAAWGLFSSLYRRVAEQLGRAPLEEDLNAAERRLLRLARDDWRLDGIPALQLFARMQHVGVPTRLIDATLNPLIASWFAVAADDQPEADGRLFAFTIKSRIQLNTRWSGNTPRWHPTGYFGPPSQWGTGLGRRVWLPPALHARIPAQNAAFLVDGVPIDGAEGMLLKSNPDAASMWSAERTRTVSSIPIRLAGIRPESRPMAKGLVFTYRITAAAKKVIRHQLEERFGYRFATIYADVEGLATYIARNPEALVTD